MWICQLRAVHGDGQRLGQLLLPEHTIRTATRPASAAALLPVLTADIVQHDRDVRFVPKADIGERVDDVRFTPRKGTLLMFFPSNVGNRNDSERRI